MRRTAAVATCVTLLGAGCVPSFVGGAPEGPEEMEPAGEVTVIGEVPVENADRVVVFESYRNREGDVCIRSEVGTTCWDAGDREVGGLPAERPIGLSWSGGEDAWCVEAEVQEGVTRVVVIDGARDQHELTHLRDAREIGIQLFVGCYEGGAMPRVLDAYDAAGQLAYRTDM